MINEEAKWIQHELNLFKIMGRLGVLGAKRTHGRQIKF